jgi:RimJ/RimL family protein N-acetyltransferase
MLKSAKAPPAKAFLSEAFETDRLILRPLSMDDFDAYANAHADPDVSAYLSLEGTPFDRVLAFRSMCTFIGHATLRGYTHWALIERSSGNWIGRAGLWNPEGWPGPEVGWTLTRSAWGKGYATEAARFTMQYAKERLQLREVHCIVHPKNQRSIRVAERLGLAQVGTHAIGALTCNHYRGPT